MTIESATAPKIPLRLDEFRAVSGPVPALDGLRAVSIIIVMAAHLVTPAIPGGHGVLLFFVISGFLITRLMFVEANQGAFNVGNFYLRRFFRLYPAIIAYVLIVTGYYLRQGPIDWIEPAAALFYFSNYLVAYRDLAGIEFQMPFKIFWSLSVEEHFYLIFPLTFLLLRSPRNIALVAVAVCSAALLLRIGAAALWPEAVASHFLNMRTEFRIDSIAFGVLLAALCELPSAERWLRMAREPLFAGTAIAIGVAAALIGDDYFANVIRPSVLGAAIAIGLHAMVFGKYSLAQRLLAWRPATWTGQLSYSLYIWHIPAGMVAATYVTGIWAVPVSFLLSFLAAYASFTLIEQRMINVRKRFGSHARSNASNVTAPVVKVVARQSR